MDDTSKQESQSSSERMFRIEDTPPIYNDELGDIFHNILQMLSLKSLYNFARVSKNIYADVDEYCAFECKKTKTKENLKEILEKNIILKKEKETLDNLREGKSLTVYALYRKLLVIRRVPAIEWNKATWGGNSQYVIPEFDVQLGREVIYLKTTGWYDMHYTFKNVSKGTYKAVIRMKTINLGCRDDGVMVMYEWYDDAGQHAVTTRLKEADWTGINTSLARKQTLDVGISDEWCALDYDFDTSWFDFCLMNLTVSSVCDVNIFFHELNGSTVDEMAFDYIELIRVNED